MAVVQNPTKNIAWKKRQAEEDRRLAQLVADGKTSSGRTVEETTKLPTSAKYKYADFQNAKNAIMNDSTTNERKMEDILSARKDAYIAKNYIQANAEAYDAENGAGASSGMLQSLEQSISEIDAYQKRMQTKDINGQVAEADRMFAINKARNDAANALKTIPDKASALQDKASLQIRTAAAERLKNATQNNQMVSDALSGGTTTNLSHTGGSKSFSDVPQDPSKITTSKPIITEQAKADAARYGITPEIAAKIQADAEYSAKTALQPTLSKASSDQTKIQDRRTAGEKLRDVRQSIVAGGENAVGAVGDAVKWTANTAVDYAKAAYDMTLGGITGKTSAQIEESGKGKKGVGLLEAVGTGLLGIPASFNAGIYGVASNYIDFTNSLGKALGLNTDPNWNPAKSAQIANNKTFQRITQNLTDNGTGLENVISNVVAMGGNSALMMFMGYGISGVAGNAMGGGVNTVNTALRVNQINNATNIAQMTPFALQSGSEAYSKVAANGGNKLQAAIAGIIGTVMSIATNSAAYEEYGERMGLGIATNSSVLAKATGVSVTATWGEAGYQWAKNAFGSMGVAEGLQEVSESLALKLTDDLFQGTVFDTSKWQEWTDQAKQEFFYGYLSGALFYTTALPSYAPSKQMLTSMVDGTTETNPEAVSNFIVQTKNDVQEPDNKLIVEDNIKTFEEAAVVATEATQMDAPVPPKSVQPTTLEQAAEAAAATQTQDAQISPVKAPVSVRDSYPSNPTTDTVEQASPQTSVAEQAPQTVSPKKQSTTTPTDVETSKNVGINGKNALKKWMGNEYVNIKAGTGDPRELKFRKFFAKYYDAGKTGKRIIDVPFDETIDTEFPPFLNQAFYYAGQNDAKKGAVKNVVSSVAPVAKPSKQPEPPETVIKGYADDFKLDSNEASIMQQAYSTESHHMDAPDFAKEYINIFTKTSAGASWQRIENNQSYKTSTATRRAAYDSGHAAWLKDNPQVDESDNGYVGITDFEAAKKRLADKTGLDEMVSQAETAYDNSFPEKEQEASATVRMSDALISKYITKGTAFNSAVLFELADKSFGGTQAQGTYTVKDAYDAMELAVNKRLLTMSMDMNGDSAKAAVSALNRIENMLSKLPTQTKRTNEQEIFQQFSTPPNIAYLAAWAAKVNANDVVLEPSAGIGGLAVFPKAWGADVVVNELSKRRLEVLKNMGFNQYFNEDAEQIDNILPDSVKPTLVIMNPPFSSTAGRTNTNSSKNAGKHIESALLRLEDGGRLVAILGKGMGPKETAFAGWWKSIGQKYSVRANISVDGSNYTKYGTSWGVQLVVIDKTGPQTSETVTGTYKDLKELPAVLEGIRNDRIIDTGNRANQQNTVVASDTSNPKRPRPVATVSGGSNVGMPGTAENVGQQQSDVPANPVRAANNVSNVSGTKRGDSVVSGLQPEPAVSSDDNGERGLYGSGNAIADRSNVQQSGEAVVPAGSRWSESSGELRVDVNAFTETRKATESEDGVYSDYVPMSLPFTGIKKHPAPLVESAAMAAVKSTKATYVPNLPATLIDSGALSGAQLEPIVLAGQAHQKLQENGERRSFFIGDGTGVGKGREIAGIILDNFRQGRTKAVWLTKNNNLLVDAVRDWTALGGKSTDVTLHNKFKPADKITLNEGILLAPYGTLSRTNKQSGTSRLDQIIEWLGKDFDGVLAFDEVHIMGNLLGKKGSMGTTAGSAVAKAGAKLRAALPNARIVYVSATGASDVSELSFADRLGLWGPGTAFNNLNTFVDNISSAGLSAMELVARDLKAMGSYLARSISYKGVKYDTLVHNLNPVQRQIYDTMSDAWQISMDNLNTALQSTGAAKNGNAKRNAKSAFFGAMQRFYNQIFCSMSMPSVVADMRKELDAGHSCVIQIVNTNAAEMERQLADAKEDGKDLEDLDLTPRGTLINYLERAFPVNVYHEVAGVNGGKPTMELAVDSNGNHIEDKTAVRMRDALIAQIQEMSIPDGPLEILMDEFGVDNVAEITGRSRRVVQVVENGKRVRKEQSRSQRATEADAQDFQSGKKHILVFSDAGGTGKSYHADLTEKNQSLRIHYLLQPGWSASKAVQGFGRTHRSNQKQPPVFKLVTTDVLGQKRFVSTIARKLDQLGALTKGQRETGGGMFTAKDNLESPLAMDSLRLFYDRLGHNRIEGLNAKEVFKQMGLEDKFYDKYGSFSLPNDESRDMKTFLNRILSIRFDKQNQIFNAFDSVFMEAFDHALQQGTLDMGMENIKADHIEILDDQVIREDTESGADTRYVQAKLSRKATLIKSVDTLPNLRDNYMGLYRLNSGEIRAVYQQGSKTNPRTGEVLKTYKMQTPTYGKSGSWNENTLESDATAIPSNEWTSAWIAEVAKQPQVTEETLHMLTGALLPIWDMLPTGGDTKAVRLTSDAGEQYLGRVISPDQIDQTLNQLGSFKRTKENFAGNVLQARILNGEQALLSRGRVSIFSRRVNNENRIEITGDNSWSFPNTYPGVFSETIAYAKRYFIPTGEKGNQVIDSIIKENPVSEIRKGNIENLISTDASKQKIKSADTSINSSKLPAVFNKVKFNPGTVNLDIGGGRFDNATDYLSGQGVTNNIYDPYNRTPEHNAAAAKATQEGKSDTVTISNVLNVVREQEARDELYANAVDAVKPNGSVYITVYEGDGTGVGKQTTKGWQENKLTSAYLPEVKKYFRDVSIKDKVIIATNPKKGKSVETLPSVNMLNTGGSEAWKAKRVGDERAVIGIDAIITKARNNFGMPITSGHIRGSAIRGQYNTQSVSIRTKIKNDLPAIAHEIGHYLNSTYKLIQGMDSAAKGEIIRKLDPAIRVNFENDPAQLRSESFAEFIRKYMQNREAAEIDFPSTSMYLAQNLDGKALAMLNELADDVNAYYSLGADNAQSEIMTREESARDQNTLKDKVKGVFDRFYLAWTDANHGIRNFDKAAGSNAYLYATNSAYSDAVAGQLLKGDLRDMNGQYVSAGLQKTLAGVNVSNNAEYRAFGEYLTVKHGPERLNEKMRIFANDMKNSTPWMTRRMIELENEYPAFKAASERLYEFQNNALQTWGVKSGLVSSSAAESWAKRWKYYVPLNRAMDNDTSAIGAKKGYANQDSTIRKARGSGRSIINPVDNIITNLIRMVNAASRNRVMQEIIRASENTDGLGKFVEQVPSPLKRITVDLGAVKQQLIEGTLESDIENTDAFLNLIKQFDDVAFQYEQGKAHGDVVTVLVDGKLQFHKVNDPMLLRSIANMSPKQSSALLDVYGQMTRFVTGNITGRNIVWSIFSNLPRDLSTYMTFSKDKNPLHLIGGMGSAYLNKFKGEQASELYKEYLGMGGGKTSAYTADKNLQRKLRKSFSDKNLDWLNPLEWLDYVGNLIESGPRYATYKIMRERYGMAPGEAFYESNDITVNFRRGGTISRQLNKVIPFFNASVQGLDKFSRWISAEEAAPDARKKASAIRVSGFIASSLAIAALMHGINGGDDDKKKAYSQLSAYTKNSYFTIPLGEGKYFAIPKPREIGVLTSLFERLLEVYDNNNKNAFEGFYSYAATNALPNFVSGVAQLDINDALSSLGLFGIFNAINSNKDYLGRPIESASMEKLLPKDKFTQRTSKVSKAFGEVFNVSPVMVDYAMGNILGGFWKWNTALFPVGDQYIDYTLGVQKSYVKDNQYSTDILNDLYNNLEQVDKDVGSNPDDQAKVLLYKMLYLSTNFNTKYQKLAKTETGTDKNVAYRQTVIDMADGVNKYVRDGAYTPEMKALEAYVVKNNGTEHYPTALNPEVKDANGIKHALTSAQYVDYNTDYLRRYWDYVSVVLSSPTTASEAGLLAAKNRARSESNEFILSQIGVKSETAADTAAMENAGVSADLAMGFEIEKSKAREDGSLKASEVLEIIAKMKVNDTQKAYLYNDGVPASTITSNPFTSVADLNKYLLTSDPEKAKSSITGTYKDLIIEKYATGDAVGAQQYVGKLLALNIYDKKGNPYYTQDMIDKWVDDYLEKQTP